MHKKLELTETWTVDDRELARLLGVEIGEHDKLLLKIFGSSVVELSVIRTPTVSQWSPGEDPYKC